MNRRTRRTIITGALAIGAAAAVTGLDRPTAPEPALERHVQTLAVTDFTDDRRLVGFADDVFVGKVVGERGTSIVGQTLETQFDVQVVRPIKGTLRGTVIVSQDGGVDDTGVTVIVDGDEPLTAGRTYVFASRTNPDTGWHTLVPSHGTVEVESDMTRTRLVDRFEAAVAAQVPFTPGS
jgi:hypothetical protein